jgi:mannose-6-phosphate isomerase-like protein (cupin superfamily)
LLLSKPAPGDVVLLKPVDQAVFIDAERGFTRRALSPAFPNRGIDVVQNTLEPGGCSGVFPAHKRGVHEYLVVLESTLIVELGEKRLTVETGDCLFFDAHVEHQLRNETARPVSWILVIDATRYVRQAL